MQTLKNLYKIIKKSIKLNYIDYKIDYKKIYSNYYTRIIFSLKDNVLNNEYAMNKYYVHIDIQDKLFEIQYKYLLSSRWVWKWEQYENLIHIDFNEKNIYNQLYKIIYKIINEVKINEELVLNDFIMINDIKFISLDPLLNTYFLKYNANQLDIVKNSIETPYL